MLKKAIIFSCVSLVFSFTHASIVDMESTKYPKSEKQSCKKKGARSLEENAEDHEYFLTTEKNDEDRKRQTRVGEAQEKVNSNTDEKNTIHSFNFLYYLIHHYKFSDFITN